MAPTEPLNEGLLGQFMVILREGDPHGIIDTKLQAKPEAIDLFRKAVMYHVFYSANSSKTGCGPRALPEEGLKKAVQGGINGIEVKRPKFSRGRKSKDGGSKRRYIKLGHDTLSLNPVARHLGRAQDSWGLLPEKMEFEDEDYVPPSGTPYQPSRGPASTQSSPQSELSDLFDTQGSAQSQLPGLVYSPESQLSDLVESPWVQQPIAVAAEMPQAGMLAPEEDTPPLGAGATPSPVPFPPASLPPFSYEIDPDFFVHMFESGWRTQPRPVGPSPPNPLDAERVYLSEENAAGNMMDDMEMYSF